jgi:hypothetical protein
MTVNEAGQMVALIVPDGEHGVDSVAIDRIGETRCFGISVEKKASNFAWLRAAQDTASLGRQRANGVADFLEY